MVVVVSGGGGVEVVSSGAVVVFGTPPVVVVPSAFAASVFAASSCRCWIAPTSRPTTLLTSTKAASATVIAESPKTRSSSALLSCIVADLVGRASRRAVMGALLERMGGLGKTGSLLPIGASRPLTIRAMCRVSRIAHR